MHLWNTTDLEYPPDPAPTFSATMLELIWKTLGFSLQILNFRCITNPPPMSPSSKSDSSSPACSRLLLHIPGNFYTKPNKSRNEAIYCLGRITKLFIPMIFRSSNLRTSKTINGIFRMKFNKLGVLSTHSITLYSSEHPADRYSVPLYSSYPLLSILLWRNCIPANTKK